jgi:hypothetical protein
MPQVHRGQRGDRRLSETRETHVVWLITQRRLDALVRSVETGQRRITRGLLPRTDSMTCTDDTADRT